MTKFYQWKVDVLKDWFEDYKSPSSEQFAWFIKACQDAIECHEHAPGGGPGSGTGDAAPLTLPSWIPDSLLYNLWGDVGEVHLSYKRSEGVHPISLESHFSTISLLANLSTLLIPKPISLIHICVQYLSL